MPQTFPDTENYAFSFSHAIIKVNDRQFTAIGNVKFDQTIDHGAVYGTDRRPLKLSAGQLAVGTGTVSFTDLAEAMDFYESLGDNPSAKRFTTDVTFSNEAGLVKSFELRGCALSGISGDFKSGADPMGLDIPFVYMETRVNGSAFAQ